MPALIDPNTSSDDAGSPRPRLRPVAHHAINTARTTDVDWRAYLRRTWTTAAAAANDCATDSDALPSLRALDSSSASDSDN
jgi:hypothetical protein